MTRQRKNVGLLIICAVLIAALGWRVHLTWESQQKEIEAQSSEIQRLETELLRARRANIEGRSDFAHVNQTPNPAKAGTIDENPLDAWINRVARLHAYLEKHPEKSIPEMASLSVNDWLDATKDFALDSEADFRKALSRLRRLAKKSSLYKTETVLAFGRALKEAPLAKNGSIPADVRELVPYLPVGFDLAILQRFRIVPSGSEEGFRVRGSKLLLVERPVDDLWDAIFIIGDNANGAVRTLDQSTIEGEIGNALVEFWRATGAPPTNLSELMPYLDGGLHDTATVKAVFDAMTTTPSL